MPIYSKNNKKEVNKKPKQFQSILSLTSQKKAQVTIFIIIAVIIIAGVVLYVILKSKSEIKQIPPEFQPAYTNFLNCFEQDLSTAINLVQAQGGYVYLPAFEPGSDYMPFSSQLNFLGNPIPYWYYVSGNNIPKEQVPTKEKIEDQISSYIENKIKNCNFNSYYEQGFSISLGDAKTKTLIKDEKVEAELKLNLAIEKENNSVLIQSHKVSINSNLGKLYDSSIKVYNMLKKETILENYTIDVLRSYAPVDGIEITCSPLIWNAEEVFDQIQNSLEANIISINNKKDKYFNIDFGESEDHEVRFLTSKTWPYSIEVAPTEGSLMIANPVGNQPGLGIIGFCYVPYHFVYSLKYPVLVQIREGQDIFQFPFAVVIQNNMPRESLKSEAVKNVVPELCLYKNTEVQINIRDKRGTLIPAEIYYECFQNECFIGKASLLGTLKENFPQCVNGYIVAKSPGYKDARYLFSTTSQGSVDIIMEKFYSKKVILNVDGKEYNGLAIINFISEDDSKTIFYPNQKEVELGENQYEIKAIVYKNSSLRIGATTSQQCIKVPRSDILGVIGLQKERCFDINVPEKLITNVIYAGGKQNYYILESELSRTESIVINVESFKMPETIEDVQKNYFLVDETKLDIHFK